MIRPAGRIDEELDEDRHAYQRQRCETRHQTRYDQRRHGDLYRSGNVGHRRGGQEGHVAQILVSKERNRQIEIRDLGKGRAPEDAGDGDPSQRSGRAIGNRLGKLP